MYVEQPASTRGNILVIDDTPHILQVLTGLLSKEGYTVRSALEGLTALASIETALPDLILLDIKMPEMNGYEVCQILKAEERTRNIPVIFISASEEVTDTVQAFEAGGADFITKPFRVREVLARIEHHLQLSRLQRELNQQKEQLLQQNQLLQAEIYERDRAEKELARERTLLRKMTSRLSILIENLQAAVLVEDELRRIVLVNQEFCNLFKIAVPPQALIGTDCSQAAEQGKSLFAEPDRFTQRINQILQQKQVVVAEELLLADGRTLERDYIPIFHGHDYQGHLWQYRDISDRKAAEAELLKKTRAMADFSASLKQLHRLNMTDFHNIEALFTDYIHAGCEVLNFSAGAIGRVQGQTYTLLAVQSDLKTLVPNVTIHLSNAYCGKVVECGQTVAVNHVGQTGMCRDRLYQSLKLESYIGTPIFVNGELYGTLCFFSTQARPQGFENHEKEIIELMAQSIGKFISAQQTESQRRQAEEALQKAKDAAVREAARSADANRTKSEFLANMSHELRTPLNAILGFTQLIVRECSLDKPADEYLRIINRSGEHLLDLINDVLEMSKIEAGRTSLNLSNFDLHYLLSSLEEMLRLKAKSKGLQLRFDCGSAVPQYVQTDEGKLRQVLINLLGNAIKFTQKGQVTLRVRAGEWESRGSTPVPAPEIENGKTGQVGENGKIDFPTPLPVCCLLFEVEDTGSGIAPADLEILFEPFVQTRSGHNSQEGTGLGLPISRKFVQLMGGEIVVNSVLGQGTLVQFNIQVELVELADIQAQLSEQRAIAIAPGQPHYRILVVEDHLESRQLLVNLLQPLGFEVQEVGNGQEAILRWESWQPHLIWMDMRMPTMNGYETTQLIRAIEARQGISLKQATKIIALTASAFEEDRTKVLAVGCNDFVRKPFTAQLILEKIAEHLGVKYIYEVKNQAEINPEIQMVPLFLASEKATPYSLSSEKGEVLHPASLKVMPAQWRQQFYQATMRGSDTQLLRLIQQLPRNHAFLAYTLTNWVNNFEFDKLLDFLSQAVE